MNTDTIFDIIDFLEYPDLISLIQVNRYLNGLDLVKIRKEKYVEWMNSKIVEYISESSKFQDHFMKNRVYYQADKTFLMAVRHGDLRLVRFLIRGGYEPSRNRNQGLIDSIKFKQYHIFSELLKSADIEGYECRLYAECADDDKLLDLILDDPNGPSVDRRWSCNPSLAFGSLGDIICDSYSPSEPKASEGINPIRQIHVDSDCINSDPSTSKSP